MQDESNFLEFVNLRCCFTCSEAWFTEYRNYTTAPGEPELICEQRTVNVTADVA